MRLAGLVAFSLLLVGCPYTFKIVRTYDTKPIIVQAQPKTGHTSFTYVYMDRDKIDAKVRQIYKDAGREWPFSYKLYGFFDYQARTLYCGLLDSELCGHELFHATHGDWHF